MPPGRRSVLVARRVGGYVNTPPPIVVPDRPQTDPTPNGPLGTWVAALNGRSTAPARVLLWGDSRDEGEKATSLAARWQEVLAASMRAAYPVTGTAPGYAPRNYVPLKYVSPSLVGLGEWSAVSVASTPNNFGLGARTSLLSTAGTHGGTLTFTGTSFGIAYARGNVAGSFTYAIDGGPAQTVSWTGTTTTDGLVARSDTLTRGTHTVV